MCAKWRMEEWTHWHSVRITAIHLFPGLPSFSSYIVLFASFYIFFVFSYFIIPYIPFFLLLPSFVYCKILKSEVGMSFSVLEYNIWSTYIEMEDFIHFHVAKFNRNFIIYSISFIFFRFLLIKSTNLRLNWIIRSIQFTVYFVQLKISSCKIVYQ